MRALLLGILFAIVGLSAFIARRLTDLPPVVPPDVQFTRREPEAPAGGEAKPTPPPEERQKSPKNAAAGPAQPATPHDDLVPEPVNEPDIATRYAGWSRTQLEERLSNLESAFLVEIDQACDKRFDAGKFRVVDASEVEGEDESYDVLAPVDENGLLTRCRMVEREVAAFGDEGEVEGSFEYQVATLSPEEYPELYQRLRELQWLRAKTGGEDPR